MIRLKQNKYPVVFLTQGITIKYPTYHDPRCQSIPMAMRHALSADILGINVHTEDILRDPSQVQIVRDRDLVMFCWGDDNNDKATIQHLKKLGLHAVIYDKIDEYNQKEVKESIFLVDARENQKALIALAQCVDQSCPPDNDNGVSYDSRICSPKMGNTSLANSSIFPMPNLLPVERLSGNDSDEGEMRSLAKNFSECANSFGHVAKGVERVEVESCGDDETANDCL